MKMTPALMIVGGLMVFWASVYVAVVLPAVTMKEVPDKETFWRPWTADEAAGHDLYVRNGCSYCHSQFVRVVDKNEYAERIAQRGDYVGQLPAILGTERTGPDLSQAGGEHPDDWQLAHFINPRNTRPMSLMPSWEFLGRRDIDVLTRYVQSLGLQNADYRMGVDMRNPSSQPTRGQLYWKQKALAAYRSGSDANIAWLHAPEQLPPVWRDMPNPYPATDGDLERGHKVYEDFCVNCHGSVGDGQGTAFKYLDPPPLNFSTLRRNLPKAVAADGKTYYYVGGIFYYQIMNGITGTAMPYFKRELESEKIWDVSNYVASRFVGYTDATLPPRGIPASYEPPWTNTYAPPTTMPTQPRAAAPHTTATTKPEGEL